MGTAAPLRLTADRRGRGTRAGEVGLPWSVGLAHRLDPISYPRNTSQSRTFCAQRTVHQARSPLAPIRGGFGTAQPMVSATFRDSRRGRGPGAGGRSVTASLMPTVPDIFVIRRAGGRPGVVPRGEHCRRSPVSLGRLAVNGKARGPPGCRVATADARPALPFILSPGNAVSAARPWPSVKQPTVCTDRHNCAYRPSLQHGRPSAMRPWTVQYDDLQRYKVTHAGTEKKRPASARIRSKRAVSAGGGRCCGGRCWVRTNVG
jgi:hypothetical protein